MGTITFNGKTFELPKGACSVGICNGAVFVNGERLNEEDVKTEGCTVTINGDCGSIQAQGSVQVSGNVKGNISCQGAVNCGDVAGNVAGNVVNCRGAGVAAKGGGTFINL